MPLATVDLMSLPVYEHYRRQRQRRLIRHRRECTVPLGPHMRVHFEDQTTLLHQIQEVRRAERNDDRSARPAPLYHRHPEPPMNHPMMEDHGPGVAVASSEIGAVTMCGCGVITVTLNSLSLRFEPEAFRALALMLQRSQQRIDRSQIGAASVGDESDALSPPPRGVH